MPAYLYIFLELMWLSMFKLTWKSCMALSAFSETALVDGKLQECLIWRIEQNLSDHTGNNFFGMGKEKN